MYAMDVQHMLFTTSSPLTLTWRSQLVMQQGWVSKKKCAKCVCLAKIKLKNHVTQLMSTTQNSPVNYFRNASHGCGANVKAHGLFRFICFWILHVR
jgi:hypothetical protein